MPPRRPAADDVSKLLAAWPTVDDLPESVRQNTQIIQTNFSLEDHLRNIIMQNPYIPPTGDRCPINDLPNELLAHIFSLGTFESDDGDDEDDMYQENADEEDQDEDEEDENEVGPILPYQVLVSHVCSHWRTVGE